MVHGFGAYWNLPSEPLSLYDMISIAIPFFLSQPESRNFHEATNLLPGETLALAASSVRAGSD